MATPIIISAATFVFCMPHLVRLGAAAWAAGLAGPARAVRTKGESLTEWVMVSPKPIVLGKSAAGPTVDRPKGKGSKKGSGSKKK